MLRFLLLVTIINIVNCECPTGPKIVCYYSSWAYYRTGLGHFNVSHIDPTLCTHLVYTFAGLDINLRITSLDPRVDYCDGSLNQLCSYRDFVNLKTKNKCLKTILAIGGWNEGSKKYSVMAYNEKSRVEFVDSVLRFLVAYDFDGLDFDWEYPVQRGGIQEDKENFAKLLMLLDERLKPWNLTLSIAVPISEIISESAFDIDAITKYVDYVSLMAYDYTPTDSTTTGLLSPLSKIKESINYWISHGLPKNKLVLGMPSYARSYRLLDPKQTGVGAPTDPKQLGPAGDYTKEPGFLSYYELLGKLLSPNYKKFEEDSNNYAFYKTEWLSYDTNNSYVEKTNYALSNGLGGVMLWSIDTDKFQKNEFTILRLIYETVANYMKL